MLGRYASLAPLSILDPSLEMSIQFWMCKNRVFSCSGSQYNCQYKSIKVYMVTLNTFSWDPNTWLMGKWCFMVAQPSPCAKEVILITYLWLLATPHTPLAMDGIEGQNGWFAGILWVTVRKIIDVLLVETDHGDHIDDVSCSPWPRFGLGMELHI